jgi:two-component system chemotaxis response regulator CheB
MSEIKVLIVDDSVVVQNMLAEMFLESANIKVIGVASNPLEAREMIKKDRPDVVILDIIMPGMDGMAFLKNLMRLRPMPVIMFSSIAQKNSPITLEAMAIGAVDCVAKPTKKEIENIHEYAKNFIDIIEQAAKVNVAAYSSALESSEKIVGFETMSNRYKSPILKDTLIGIGSSVGGSNDLETLLMRCPGIMPSIVVTQYMGKGLELNFQKELDKVCSLGIVNAVNQGKILPGHVYLANSSESLGVQKDGLNYFCSLENSTRENEDNPVDTLFTSMAKVAGSNSIGILLGSMGSDGLKGLQAIREAGGATIMQESCLAKGAKAADYVISASKICDQILRILDKRALR